MYHIHMHLGHPYFNIFKGNWYTSQIFQLLKWEITIVTSCVSLHQPPSEMRSTANGKNFLIDKGGKAIVDKVVSLACVSFPLMKIVYFVWQSAHAGYISSVWVCWWYGTNNTTPYKWTQCISEPKHWSGRVSKAFLK